MSNTEGISRSAEMLYDEILTTERNEMIYWRAMPAIYCSLLLAVGGCAVIPGTQSGYLDTKNTTPRVYSSKLERSLAAKCVIKKIDERLGEMIALLTPEAPRPH